MAWFQRTPKEPPQPRPYAVRVQTGSDCKGWESTVYSRWIKAVCCERPKSLGGYSAVLDVVGPFRNEVDCDEFIAAAMMPTNRKATA